MLRAILMLPLLALPGFALAQDMPACGPGRTGAVACMSGKLCLCRFERGGQLTGNPDGHRWDCGVMRPQCGEALPPAGIGLVPMYPTPDLLLQVPPLQHQPRSPWPR
jgi:hypothetical protein